MKIISSNRGVTLIELLIATVVIVIAAVGMLEFYVATINLSQENKEEIVAMAHLGAMMEAIKSTPFNRIVTDFPDGVSGVNYEAIIGGYVLTGEEIIVNYADSQSDPLEVSVSVSWQDRRGANRTKYLVTKRTR